MTSGPITSWQMGKKWKQWDCILGGSKIIADGDCSDEIKRHLLLWRKAMTNLDSILKSRDITTKVHLVKAMIFPVVMYECEIWTIKIAERLHFHFSLLCIGGGNGNLLQCSCLENPRDGRAWWAAVYGVTQIWTRLKRLSSSSSRAPNNWCFWTVVLEKTLESPLDCKEIQPVHPKGNQS